MNHKNIFRIKTISEFHQFRGLPKPEHPLVSVVNLDDFTGIQENWGTSLVLEFYSISLKRMSNVRFKYGQQQYDFDEGIMFFLAPGQVFGIEFDDEDSLKQYEPSGWMLLIHPDFLWNTTLAHIIRQYEYFDYSVSEALFLSEKEENTITEMIKHIRQEYHTSIDQFSQDIIISQIEVLLNYADRFYHRQFLTRKIANDKILDQLEQFLNDYFNHEDLTEKGLPTVQSIAQRLNMSPNYLSGLLKTLSGQSTQQHIHEKLVEKAKEKLSTTNLSVSEIAYELGFEHPQSFSKLFRSKTNLSPLEFRHSFN